MARNKTLQELVAQLRAETNRSQNVSAGVGELDNLKELIRRTQEVLYDEYEWPFLRVERTIALADNQRYYDFPDDLNYDRVMDVKLKYNNVYVELERGILLEDFSTFDSNATTPEKSFPTLKWDVRNTGSGEQMEVWPIPNQTASVYFFGTKTLSALIEDDDRADLDDRLIILFAASELLARQKSADANIKLNQANNRLLKLRANSQAGSKSIQVGLGNRQPDRSNRNRVHVVVGG